MTNRWGRGPFGIGPWVRQELIFVGRDADGFAIREWRHAEENGDFGVLFDHASAAWHADEGVSSRILDADGNTVFIFD